MEQADATILVRSHDTPDVYCILHSNFSLSCSSSLDNWSPKLGNESLVLSTLSRAFSAWSEYSPLSFRRTSRRDKADIALSFGRYSHGDSYPFDGPGYVLAHAYYPYDYGALGGDVHFDGDEDWSPGGGVGTDFFAVAVHELGHSLGLSHSPDQGSIMFPYYRGAAGEDFHIGYDDILAMYELYGKCAL